MTITPVEVLFYCGALFVLFITPGPVWVALIARAVSGGFRGAWPLALGVVVGDVVWPLFAIFGVSFLVSVYADFLVLLKYFGAVMFLAMGAMLLWKPDQDLTEDSRLTKPGMWAGFVAGVLVILSNPKAVLFYMGVLPGFFDFASLTVADIVVICLASMIVPLVGNLFLALMVDQVRGVLRSESAVKRMNTGAGIALVFVGLVIAVF